MSTTQDQTTAIERYTIRRRLGAGGMGVVYEAFDKKRGQLVALKTLRWADGAAIYRFKREFRSLTNVRHPNLVSLYELSARGDEWFFTMERVDGVDFLKYVSPLRSPQRSDTSNTRSTTPKVPDPAAIQRLRSALPQLAQGLVALHEAGKVHQDIKPTNVLVTPAGRVVILDFGLTADSGLTDPLEVTADSMWGTAGYMAPEYGNGPPGPAADWYAVGTMLYEALTDQPPFTGGPSTMLRARWQTGRPAPGSPSSLVQGLPRDLVDLCMAMLSHEPRDRPDGPEILRRLDIHRPSSAAITAAHRDPAVFVGRSTELNKLEAALHAVDSGETSVVLVGGPSGIGKSTLVSEFLRRLPAEPPTVTLRGRCYPRETVPDKALDGLVEHLAAYLRRLPAGDTRRMIPAHLNALVHLFSILRQVPAFATDVLDAGPPPGDRMEIRRRGYEALSELLAKLATGRRLVLHVDDMQWADDESMRGLCDVLTPMHPLPLLLVASFRSDWDKESAVRQRLKPSVGHVSTIELGPLTSTSTHQLVTGLAPTRGYDADFCLEIHNETDGNPFLIEQMVRHVSSRKKKPPTINIDEIIRSRMSKLDAPSRSLMEAVAVAGHPVNAETVHRAANLEGDERTLAAHLEVARFIRIDEHEQLEPFHDRIRQAIVAALPVERTRLLHRRLAEALCERDDTSKSELLFEHYLAAGDLDRAREHARIAANNAVNSLSFERAIQLYRWALRLEPADTTAGKALHTGLASALSGAGRLSEAADEYLMASALSQEDSQIENRRLAAEHMLLSGRIEDGLREISAVLRAAGLRMAKTPRQAFLSLIWSRIRLRVRMATMRITSGRWTRSRDVRQVDVCRSIAEGLAHLDFVHAADFQARHARLALSCGDPGRAAIALAIEAGFSVLHGGRAGQRRGNRLLQQAEELAAEAASTHALGLCALMSGTIAYFRGEWTRARSATARAQEQLRTLGTGVAWEIMTSQLYHTLSLFYRGDLQALVSHAGRFLSEAELRGNRFASTIAQTGPANVIWLVRDDTAGARTALHDALDMWPQKPFRTPHYLAMTANARIALYEGDGEMALKFLQADWPAMKSTGLLRIQVIRVIMWHLQASCRLGAPNPSKDSIASALRDAHRIKREGRGWCQALGLAIEGQAAALQGDNAAPRMLRKAYAALQRADMNLHAQAARRQLGLLLQGDEGRKLVQSADEWMVEQGVWSPERMAGMVFPALTR